MGWSDIPDLEYRLLRTITLGFIPIILITGSNLRIRARLLNHRVSKSGQSLWHSFVSRGRSRGRGRCSGSMKQASGKVPVIQEQFDHSAMSVRSKFVLCKQSS